MLTPDSEVKKVFTNQFYTERKLLTRSVKDSTRNIRLKTGSNGLTRVNYSVTETPIFSGYKNMSYFSVLF